MQGWDKRLMGISMDLPATYLNATKPFTAPQPTVTPEHAAKKGSKETSFLWQAPNSHAMLFMGQKWMELHGFVAEVLEVQQESKEVPKMLADKEVSKKYPSWLEHALRLARARGYFTLYPSADTASTVAIVHNDLYQSPEEYKGSRSKTGAGDGTEVRFSSSGMLDTLPDDGDLVPFNSLPLLTWDGKLTNLPEMDEWSARYSAEFRREVGGCDKEASQTTNWDRAARDLFCKKKSSSKGLPKKSEVQGVM
jgi:hypothetical protein